MSPGDDFTTLACNPAGAGLATGSRAGVVKFWTMAGELTGSCGELASAVESLRWHP